MIELQVSMHLGTGLTNLGKEFQRKKHQYDQKGDPDWGQDGIVAGSKKGRKLQVLLEPLDKQLRLPAICKNIIPGYCQDFSRTFYFICKKLITTNGMVCKLYVLISSQLSPASWP
ncbi:MAG: hypothetical protein CSA33_01730 [Desulfobulbus propionicus]|nr:MAG: hypothetical protein CSA33_01730 [Desulfobulbus propionicus]